MSAVERVELLGGSFENLVHGSALTREGVRVDVSEPSLRVGGSHVTESFLTPFRFNLGPGLVRRPPITGLRVLEPDPLLTVGRAELGRGPVALAPSATVRETLDASGIDDPDTRVLLTALALLLGIDPHAQGAGGALARAAAELDDLVAVEGGNGLAVALLVDEIVGGGGRVVEGLGPVPAAVPPQHDGLGTCRLFVGLRCEADPTRAFATAFGFDDEASLELRVAALRSASVVEPVGFLLRNAHLDPRRPGDPLGSFVWQGIVPASGEGVSRRAYTAAVLDTAGVAAEDVIFSLLWLPGETGELLAAGG